jgi:hypothetical protein
VAVATLVLWAVALPLNAGIIIPHPFDSTHTILSLSQVSSINISNDGAPLGKRVYFGTLNLNNNDLVVQASNESTALLNLANVADMVRSGYDSGDWLGAGITSQFAADDFSQGYGNIGVGVILNDDGSHVNPDGSGGPIWTTFDGAPVDQYAVLVKYTFYGDLDLKGSITFGDVLQVAHNVGNGHGWPQGEFTYSGSTVTHDDLVAANESFYLQQDYPLATPAGSPPEVPPPPSVPEPSSALLIAIGLAGAAFIRRWR